MFNGGGFGNILKQAQAVQANLQKVQEELKNLEIEGQSGAGMVQVLMTGSHCVRKVTIDRSLKDEDLDMIEDLVAAACNDAVSKVESVSQEKMKKVTGGMPLPPGFKMPF